MAKRTLGIGLAIALALALGTAAVVVRTRDAEAQEVTITAQDMYFTPDSLTVEAGKPVKLTFVNHGSIDHDIVFAGLSAEADMDEGMAADAGEHDEMLEGEHAMDVEADSVHATAHSHKQSTVEFTPPAGTYELYCSIPGHREAGMTGTIQVE